MMRKNKKQVSGLQNLGLGFDFNGDIIILTIPPIALIESSFGSLVNFTAAKIVIFHLREGCLITFKANFRSDIVHSWQ